MADSGELDLFSKAPDGDYFINVAVKWLKKFYSDS